MNKWVKRFLYFMTGIVVLLLIAFALLQTDWAKNLIKEKIEAYVSGKTNTRFEIGSLDYSLPKWVELRDVLLLDGRKDTLLFGGLIKADVAMLQLIQGKYRINKVELENLYANLVRTERDTLFNYSSLLNAFKSKEDNLAESKDSSAIDLSINNVRLKNIRFNLLDYAAGSFTKLKIKDLALDLNSIDVNALSFDINKLTTNEFRLELITQKAGIEDRDSSITSPGFPSIEADSILIQNSFVLYKDEFNKTTSSNNIGLLQLTGLSNKNHPNLFKGNTVVLDRSNILFNHLPITVSSTNENINTDKTNSSIGIQIKSIQLTNNNITYNNESVPAKINGIDVAHLDISALHLQSINNEYNKGRISATIQNVSFKDKSGFQLDSLSGLITMDSSFIRISDLLVRTPGSRIDANAMIYPLSLTGPNTGTNAFQQNEVLLSNAVFSQKDIRLLAPEFAAGYQAQLTALGDLTLNANMSGNGRQMNIQRLQLNSSTGKLRATMNGSVSYINDPNRLLMNLAIQRLTVQRDLLYPFLKNAEQPITLPPVVNINGTLKGAVKNLQTNLQLQSAFGKLVAKGTIQNASDPEKMRYNMLLTATDLETGKWIGQDSLLGKLTGSINVKGQSLFDLKKSSVNANANIRSFRVQQNIYNNIKLQTNLDKGLASIIGSINDPFIQANINGTANLNGKYPTAVAALKVNKADLYALGFTTDTMTVQVQTQADIRNLDPQFLDLTVVIDSVAINNGTTQFGFDSTTILAFMRNDSTIVTLDGPLAKADISSNLNYEQIPVLVTSTLNRYLPAAENTTTEKVVPGSIQANLEIKPNVAYNALLQNLAFDDVNISMYISNQTDSVVKATLTANTLQVGGNRLTNISSFIAGTGDSLQLNTTADTILIGNFLLHNAFVQAGYGNGNMAASLKTEDGDEKEQFAIALNAAQKKSAAGGYVIHLGEPLKLNYTDWNVSNNNQIVIDNEGFNIQDFKISNNNASVALQSSNKAMNAPVTVAVDNFTLRTIFALLNQDSMQVDGLLNADFTAADFAQPIPTLDGNLTIDSIIFLQQPVGNIAIKASSNNNQVAVTGKLDGHGNNVNIDGTYTSNQINIALALQPLSLASVEPFTMGNLKRSSGNISGTINITGQANAPQWNGDLTFNNVQTTAAAFGTKLQIDQEIIRLTYPQITLDDFTIKDSTGNPLTINGTIVQNKNNDFVTNLTVKTDNFLVINNTSTDNESIYGKALIGLDAGLNGSFSAPDISGNLTVKNGTDITYVRQPVAALVREREELIEFVDMDTISNLIEQKTLAEEKQFREKINSQSFNYNLNVEIEEKATFSLVIDPATKDQLQVEGNGQINLGSNPNGDITTVGVYNLNSGSYQLNFGVLKRRFDLLTGSTVTLSGDPLNAMVNITAAYEIETSPTDLIGNEISGSLASAEYRKKVPFQVLLTIKGPISKPQLGFDIVAKPGAEGISYELRNSVDNKLQQLRNDPSAMNKQVFALLTFNRFVGEKSSDFFAGNNGFSNNNLLANESVSGFLSAALDQLAQDLLKGVEVDVNLKNVDDGVNQQRTDLNVALGKTFFNNRLNVTFGKNFTVDGSNPSAKARNGTNSNVQFLPDVNTTYKLSKDGRYMIRAYRRNQYEAVMDGFFIETGVAFTLTMDYEKLKDLLSRKKGNE